jgi:protein gp37
MIAEGGFIMSVTKIEWADRVWNPITGCSPVSEGCLNCYARRMAYRLKGRYGYPTDDPFRVTFHPDRLDEPLHWKKPSRIFVCSMGDLFDENVKHEWFIPIMHKIRLEAKQHTYLFLTKRPQNIDHYLCEWYLKNISNLWLGVSISTNKDLWMVETLLQIPAAKRFISVEPMLGPVNIPDKFLCPCSCYAGKPRNPHPDCEGLPAIDWVICGGETGPKARPLHPDWVKSLVGQCRAARVPFFFKSWGEWSPFTPKFSFQQYKFGDGLLMHRVGHKAAGRLLDGKIWEETP